MMKAARRPPWAMLAFALCAAQACGGEPNRVDHGGTGGSAESGLAGSGGSSGSGGAAAGAAKDASADATTDASADAMTDASTDRSSGDGASGGFGSSDAATTCVCDGNSYGPGEQGLKCFCQEFGCSLQVDVSPSSWSCGGGNVVVYGGPDCGRVTFSSCWGNQVVSELTYDLPSGKLLHAYYENDVDEQGCGLLTTAGTLVASSCADAATACSLCPSSCCGGSPACDQDAGAGGAAGAAGAGSCG